MSDITRITAPDGTDVPVTDNEARLAFYERRGYLIEHADPVATLPFDALTVAQLKAYAAEHGVDLGEAKEKADLVAVLTGKPAEGEKPNGEQPPADPPITPQA